MGDELRREEVKLPSPETTLAAIAAVGNCKKDEKEGLYEHVRRKSVEIERMDCNPYKKEPNVNRSAPPAQTDEGGEAPEFQAVAVESGNGEVDEITALFDRNELYTNLQRSDFEEPQQSLEELLERTDAWYRNLDRKEAERAVTLSLRSSKDASHEYLFRSSSSVKPESEKEEVFVLTEAKRQQQQEEEDEEQQKQKRKKKDTVTHYILFYTQGKLGFKPGGNIPEKLSTLSECKDVVELLGEHLQWTNPIPVSRHHLFGV